MAISLFVATLGGLIWSVVIILDRIALKNIFTHPLQALIITCFMGFFGFLIMPFVDFSMPTINSAFLALVAGVTICLSYIPYFYAMNLGDDATEVAVWDAAHPMLIALFGITLGLTLSVQNWIGVVLICGSIVAFQWSKKSAAILDIAKWKFRSLLILNATAMAITYLLMGFVLTSNSYWDVYPFYLAGSVSGIIMIFYKPIYRSFKKSWRNLRTYWWLFVIMESGGILAPLLITYAMINIHPAIASALGATFPIYITLAGPILRKFGAKEELFPKVHNIGIRLIALIVLSFSISLLYNPDIL